MWTDQAILRLLSFTVIVFGSATTRSQEFAVSETTMVGDLVIIGMLDKEEYGPADSARAKQVIVNNGPRLEFDVELWNNAVSFGRTCAPAAPSICGIQRWRVVIPEGTSVLVDRKVRLMSPAVGCEDHIWFSDNWCGSAEPYWGFAIPIRRVDDSTAVGPATWSHVKKLLR